MIYFYPGPWIATSWKPHCKECTLQFEKPISLSLSFPFAFVTEIPLKLELWWYVFFRILDLPYVGIIPLKDTCVLFGRFPCWQKVWQNCTTPAFNRNFGIFLGWHVIIRDGSQVKAFAFPSPDHPPSQFFWHIKPSVPEWKSFTLFC